MIEMSLLIPLSVIAYIQFLAFYTRNNDYNLYTTSLN